MSRSVTVIMATHNGLSRGFLKEALDSIESQTLRAEHVLIADDGSSDGTAAYVKEHYPRFKVLQVQAGGVSAARNAALTKVDTDYVAFLDDDDVYHADKLAVQVSHLEANPGMGLVFCGMRFIDENGAETGLQLPVPLGLTWPEILLHNHIPSPSAVLVRADVAKKAGLFDVELRQGEDFDWYMRCARAADLCYVEDVLLDYRRHSGQASSDLNYIDDKTYDIIARNAELWLPHRRTEILKYFAQGVAIRAFLRRDFSFARRWLGRGGFSPWAWGKRVVGFALSPWSSAKLWWRRCEYRRVLGDDGRNRPC